MKEYIVFFAAEVVVEAKDAEEAYELGGKILALNPGIVYVDYVEEN